MHLRPAILPVLFACASAQAATFTVSNINDSGPGSLREAIAAANAAPVPPHRITFDAGVQQQGLIELFSSLPLIQVALEIDGTGCQPSILPFDTSAGFTLLRSSKALTLRDMSLSGGRGDGKGGCLSGEGLNASSPLVLDKMTFTGCAAVVYTGADMASGGAVSWPVNTRVTIRDSVFDGNSAATLGSGMATGGALSVGGPLHIASSSFTNNLLNGGFVVGAAVHAYPNGPGDIDIHDSIFESNIANSDPGSSSPGLGGALSLDCDTCTASIQRNYFADNHSGFGGALFLRGNAGIVSATLHNNSFVDNQAGTVGGAFSAVGTKLDVRHSTFSNNSAPEGGHAYVTSSTIDEWSNSIMMDVAAGSGPACSIGAIATVAVGNFLPDGNNDCNVSLPGGTRIADFRVVGVNRSAAPPILEFASTSPVVDAADTTRCLPTDARDTPRPQDGNGDGIAACDAGAFERPVPDRIFRSGFDD